MYRSIEQQRAERALCYLIEHPEIGMIREIDIDGANGRYYATRAGDIVSLCHNEASIITATQRNEDGYCYVDIAGNKHYLHRLIAFVYLIEEQPETKIVHHLDRNRANNSVSNLIYLDPKKHRLIHYYLTKWDKMLIEE